MDKDNAGIAYWRRQAHKNFDPVWRDNYLTRDEAYVWLASKMGIEGSMLHIGEMDEDQCKRVIDFGRDFLADPVKAVTREFKRRDKAKRRIDRQFSRVRSRKNGYRT